MALCSNPPQIQVLLQELASLEVAYVLVGSVAAMAYSADVEPGDLDITPGLDEANLSRLGKLLMAVGARPGGDFGHWSMVDGERKWVSIMPTTQDIAERESWQPNPRSIETIDALFYTRLGNLDIVPDLAGDYPYLIARAPTMNAFGQTIRVANVYDLLAALTVPRRKKDAERVRLLRQVQRQGGFTPE